MSLDCESHTQCGDQLGQSSYLWSGRGSNGSVWSRVFHAAVSPVSNTVLKDWINTKDLIGHFEFIRHRIWKQPGSEDWRNWEVSNQGNWKLTRNRNAHFKYLKDYQTRKDMFLFCIHLRRRNVADVCKLPRRDSIHGEKEWFQQKNYQTHES